MVARQLQTAFYLKYGVSLWKTPHNGRTLRPTGFVLTYVLSEQKFPWFIDFLNINLDTTDLEEAKRRIGLYREQFVGEGVRVTENLDFLG